MRGKALITAAIAAAALALPAAANAYAKDYIAEADSAVSTGSITYSDFGPSVTVPVKAKTPVSIWAYVQAEQTLPSPLGQSAWVAITDNGVRVWYSYFNGGGNTTWDQGLWTGPTGPAPGFAQNITVPVGTFTPTAGNHTYDMLYYLDETGNTVSFRYRTLFVRVGSSPKAPAPNLTHPLTP